MPLDERLAALVEGLQPERRVLVAIDGPDAAGKTTLARRLAQLMTRPVVLASVDGWHHRREVRARRGVDSAEGYYLDSFDYEALTAELLTPFAQGADTVRTARFDVRTDQLLPLRAEPVAATAALLFDGVFLQRNELKGCWDLTVYLHIPESVTMDRAVMRDVESMGSRPEVAARYERRYLPGQALYRQDAAPADHADIVVDNSDLAAPRVLRWRVPVI